MQGRSLSLVTIALNSFAFLAFLIVNSIGLPVAAQKPSGYEIERGRVMLQAVKADLKKHYYDPQFRGMDLEARFKAAEEKIKTASSLGQILGTIAQALIDLNDSHTYFVAPERSFQTEYGWQVQMVGDQALVTAVKPGSDAETKGLRPGDRIVTADGIELDRQNMWIFKYLYNSLRPQPGIRVEIVKPDGHQQQLALLAKVKQGKLVRDLTTGEDYNDLVRRAENESRLLRHRYVEFGDDLFIWKMPNFDMPRMDVDDFVGKFRKRKGLLLDLRGNGGGYEETLLRLIANMFDHDVTVANVKSRKEQKTVIAKSRGNEIFKGKLVVLIDSRSGSASELFARIVQLEKRGIVIGDVSAGAVMRSRMYDHQLGVDTVVPYGVSITESDVIMSDGSSLEHVGVVPDESRLPTAADLAANRDPVLAYAASLLGVEMQSEKAGSLFPIEWRK
jgi:carboxyl-terminal processing protease